MTNFSILAVINALTLGNIPIVSPTDCKTQLAIITGTDHSLESTKTPDLKENSNDKTPWYLVRRPGFLRLGDYDLGSEIVEKIKKRTYLSNEFIELVFAPYHEFIHQYTVDGLIDDRRWKSLIRKINKYDEETKVLHALAFEIDYPGLYKYQNTDIEQYIMNDLRYYCIKELSDRKIDYKSLIIRDEDGIVIDSKIIENLFNLPLPKRTVLSNEFRTSLIVLIAKELGIIEKIENREELIRRFEEFTGDDFLEYSIESIRKEVDIISDNFQDLLIDKERTESKLMGMGLSIELQFGLPSNDQFVEIFDKRIYFLPRENQEFSKKIFERNNVLNSGEILIRAREEAGWSKDISMANFIADHPEKFPSFKAETDKMREKKAPGYLAILARVMKLESGELTDPKSFFEMLTAYEEIIKGKSLNEVERQITPSIEVATSKVTVITKEEMTDKILGSKAFADHFKYKGEIEEFVKGLDVEIIVDSYQGSDSLGVLKSKVYLSQDVIDQFVKELQLDVTEDFLISLHQVAISQQIINLDDVLKKTGESLGIELTDLPRLILMENFDFPSLSEYVVDKSRLKIYHALTQIQTDRNLDLFFDTMKFYIFLQEHYSKEELQQKLKIQVMPTNDKISINIEDYLQEPIFKEMFIFKGDVDKELLSINEDLIARGLPSLILEETASKIDSLAKLRQKTGLTLDDVTRLINVIIAKNNLGEPITSAIISGVSLGKRTNPLIQQLLTEIYQLANQNSYNYPNLLENLRLSSLLGRRSVAITILNEMGDSSPFKHFENDSVKLERYIDNLEKGKIKISPAIFWELIATYKRLIKAQSISKKDVVAYFSNLGFSVDIIKGEECVSNPGTILKFLREQAALKIREVISFVLNQQMLLSSNVKRNEIALSILLGLIEDGKKSIDSADFLDLLYFYEDAIKAKTEKAETKIVKSYDESLLKEIIDHGSIKNMFDFLISHTGLELDVVFKSLQGGINEVPLFAQELMISENSISDLSEDISFQGHLLDVLTEYNKQTVELFKKSILTENNFPNFYEATQFVPNDSIVSREESQSYSTKYPLSEIDQLHLDDLKKSIDSSTSIPFMEAIYSRYYMLENLTEEAQEILDILLINSLEERIEALSNKFEWMKFQERPIDPKYLVDDIGGLVGFIYNGLKKSISGEDLSLYLGLIFPELTVLKKGELFDLLGKLAVMVNNDNLEDVPFLLEEIYPDFNKKALGLLKSIGFRDEMLPLLGFKDISDLLIKLYNVNGFWRELLASIDGEKNNFKHLLLDYYDKTTMHKETFLALFTPVSIQYQDKRETYYIYEGRKSRFVLEEKVFEFFKDKETILKNRKTDYPFMLRAMKDHDLNEFSNANAKSLTNNEKLYAKLNGKTYRPNEFKHGHTIGGTMRAYYHFDGDNYLKKLYFLGGSELKKDDSPTLAILLAAKDAFEQFMEIEEQVLAAYRKLME